MQSPTLARRTRFDRCLYERKRADGTTAYELDWIDPATGRQVRRTLPARNRTEARQAKADLISKLGRGEVVAPSRTTLREVADEWLSNFDGLVAAGERSPRTVERYRENVERHILPALGRVEVQKVTPDHIARLIRAKREAGLASWTVKGMLTPLGRIFALAVRRGYVAESPLHRLDSEELPKGKAKSEPRVLAKDEIVKLLRHAPATYRPILATGVFSGLRMMELLGLTWEEVDFDAGVIRVRYQLSRATREEAARRVPLKSKAARRDVRLLPELAALLREHKLASRHSLPEDYVFATTQGTPFYYRNVSIRGLDKAADRSGLSRDGEPRLTMHDLRHTFASHLIRQGLDPVRAARQLGHARPSITLDVYSHDFEAASQRDDVGQRLAAAFEGLLL